MKYYSERDGYKQALQDAKNGEQALFTHWWIGTRDAPPCFRGRKFIGKLYDQNAARLEQTARGLGVRVIMIHHKGLPQQHVDLVGKPLEKAIERAEVVA